LEMQYHTRRQSAHAGNAEGESRIILAGGERAGWLLTVTTADQVWLSEIMVLAPFRGQGIGSAVLREVLTGAARKRIPVRLTVNILNTPAIRLYERLGFRRTGGNEIQHVYEAQP
jgi:ribosomal protein S18 acetylase RimI-like enzyme